MNEEHALVCSQLRGIGRLDRFEFGDEIDQVLVGTAELPLHLFLVSRVEPGL